MSRLESIRALRDAVVENKRVGNQSRLESGEKPRSRIRLPILPTKKKELRQKKIEWSGIDFRQWLTDVNEAVDSITGMDMDILPEMPWQSWFKEGMEPEDAARLALEAAELGDDISEEEEELNERGFFRPSYQKWISKLDKRLRKKGGATLSALKRAGRVSNSTLHSIFMSQATAEMAARMLLQAVGTPMEDEAVSLRRRNFVSENQMEDSFDQLRDLMDEFGIGTSRPPVTTRDIGEPEEGLDEENTSSSQETHELPQKAQSPSQLSQDVSSAIAAVRAVEEKERAHKDAQSEIEEASVQGGDYGRWGPATTAAGSAGRSLASAIAKASGESYHFHQEGMAQSADVGSDLWFEIEPKNPKSPIYYLGIKIKGDKEDPRWDVMLKKGAGLGSATSVGSKRGIETSKLKGAINELKAGLKQKTKKKDGDKDAAS